MSAECYPITVLPHTTALYRAYLEVGSQARPEVQAWFGPGLRGGPFAGTWMDLEPAGGREPQQLAEALRRQAEAWGASSRQMESIARLGRGARAVVTGQQVGLLGGPLLVLEKAATAIARAREATERARMDGTGVDFVPVFWLATEDHDLAEVDQISLPTETGMERLGLGLPAEGAPVGGVRLGEGVEAVLAQAEELLGWAPLGWAPLCDLLRACYRPEATFGDAFGRLLTRVFANEGLVVMDAAGREFHALGRATLRAAIERADELEAAVIARGEELVAAGFHAQVTAAEGMSLLFLLDEIEPGRWHRVALRRTGSGATGDGGWKAGRRVLSTEELLGILEETPERISPNALLRPVFQDTILPTAAYVGGPAEVAYWAQSAAVYERVLGRVTPVLPRLSATLLEPAVAAVMDREEVELPQAMTTAEELALRLGARAMPIELKRRLGAVGHAMGAELDALEAYVGAMDESLGRAAAVSGSKMRYQMNRLRRMAARHELEREASLRKHATAIALAVFPEGHPQERVVAGVWFLARYEGLVGRLVEEAKGMCGGHAVVRL